jgi:hypothetical protein
MALLDFDKGRITRTPNPVDRVTTAKKRQSTHGSEPAIESAGTKPEPPEMAF